MIAYNALVGDLATNAARNSRRYVFYSQPNGAATMTGLMSLAEPEETDGPEFDWHERRLRERFATSVDFTDGSAGPWQNAAGTGGATVAFTAGATARINVSTNELMQNWSVGERIVLRRQRFGSGDERADVFARITGITISTATTGILTVVVQDAITVNNTANTDEGHLIQSLGLAFAEGSLAPGSSSPIMPINPGNYTQIFRDAVAFSATQCNQPLFFDEQGGARGMRRDKAMDHLIQIENAVLFGQRSKTLTTDATGTDTVVRTMGGIRWFLQQYELANGGTFLYRPGGAALNTGVAATDIANEGKRIIQFPVSGIALNATWKLLERRIFKTSMTAAGEKLMIGGEEACAAVLNYYRATSAIRITRVFENEPKRLSFDLTTISTDYGTLHVKSHPRFNDQGVLSRCAYVVDLNNIRLRPMKGRDTHLQENIHERGFDGRKDGYLTEIGLEVRFPETHMWLENLASIATT